MTRQTLPRAPSVPGTAAGRDMLKDMRTLWGVEAWRTYPWQIDVLRIEAEATQAERERVRAARFVAEHWRYEAMLDPQGPIFWGAVAHACGCVLNALDGERDPKHLGIMESKHDAFLAILDDAPEEAT